MLPGSCSLRLLEVRQRLLDLPASEDDVAEVDEHTRVARPQLGRPAKRSTGLVETARERERAAELAPGIGVVRSDLGGAFQIADRLRVVQLEPGQACHPEQLGVVGAIREGRHCLVARASKSPAS